MGKQCIISYIPLAQGGISKEVLISGEVDDAGRDGALEKEGSRNC